MAIDRFVLVLNLGLLDVDRCVDIIVGAYRAKAARVSSATA
jgi:hypothetical protein